MLFIMLVVMFFGHCLVINREMICHYGETLVCLKLVTLESSLNGRVSSTTKKSHDAF